MRDDPRNRTTGRHVMSHAIARGLSHVALVRSDMYETVKIWEDVGIPLLKMEELPRGGQHSFHDMGNGAMLSYMTFDGAPAKAPGIASQHMNVVKDGAATAIASMNHVAMDRPGGGGGGGRAGRRARGGGGGAGGH